jgi:Flp pilus assembly protein TadG
MTKRSKRGMRRERGQALVEFGLIAPVLVILIFGFTDVARVYHAWVTIQGAAREGARYGVTGQDDCNTYTDSRVDCIKYAATQRTNPLTGSPGNVTVKVRSWDYPSYANPATENSAGEACDAIEVQVEYDFVATTPLVGDIFGALHLTGRERLVNEPFGPCN